MVIHYIISISKTIRNRFSNFATLNVQKFKLQVIISLISPLLLVLACIGYGGLLTRIFGCYRKERKALESITIELIIGMGIWGWVLFFIGISANLTPLFIWLLLLPGLLALITINRKIKIQSLQYIAFGRQSKKMICLFSIFLAVLVLDFLEGLSPPADGDTLAYHAAIPKFFAIKQAIEFYPMAVDGAVPLLTHLGYTSALILGGELALTLWLMVSGWATGLLIYAFLARQTNSIFALAIAILFLTTPAILYSGGSGHVEVRSAGFVLAATILFIDARESGKARAFAIVGILAGYFIATKYFGLIFAASLGLIILLSQRNIKAVLVYSFFTLIIGCQWYIWNFAHTGDPFFPSLFSYIGAPDNPYWTVSHSKSFSDYFSAAENPLAINLLNCFMYPVYATFHNVSGLESGRTGFGIFTFFILPFVIYGLIKFRFWKNRNFIFFSLTALFFTIWFFSGTTQRVRHLVPIYPLVLIGTCLLAHQVSEFQTLMKSLWFSVLIVIFIQFSGQLLFSFNYGKFVLTNETRQNFLERNVSGTNAAYWINRNLKKSHKVAIFNRELAYVLNIPYFFLHPYYQAQIEWRPNKVNQEQFLIEIKRAGITHFLLTPPKLMNDGIGPKLQNFKLIDRFIKLGCFQQIRSFKTTYIPSRTLAALGREGNKKKIVIYKFEEKNCST